MYTLIFVKYPHPGQVKTRLAAHIGDQRASALYQAFVCDQLETMRRADVDPVICCAPNATLKDYRAWLGPYRSYAMQKGEDLGHRMCEALRTALSLDSPVILVGSDIPDLPATHLDAARQALEHATVCFGPTPDGGFYLVGARDPAPLQSMFMNVTWSTEHVLAQTTTNCRRLGIVPHLLPPWPDVDTMSDLRAFVARNSQQQSNTMDCLHRLGWASPNIARESTNKRKGKVMSQTYRPVYSTEHGTLCPTCGANPCSCRAAQSVTTSGPVRVTRETKGRKGAGVTIICGLGFTDKKCKTLLSQWKKLLGCGGTYRDGVLELQGDHRDTLVMELQRIGITAKKSG